VKIATWNVNSLNVRLPRVLELLAQHEPDVLCMQETKTEAAILGAGGLVDAYRHLHPDEVQHTWWDYRQGHFHRGMGLRIDLVLTSDVLAGSLVACGIARDYRKGSKPSDHAPLLVELGP
jgi:exonuclease III